MFDPGAVRLGKKPGVVRDLRTLQAKRYIRKATLLPTAPKRVTHTYGLDWGMLGNDSYGDCTFAGAVHLDHGVDRKPEPDAQAVVDAYLAFTHGQDSGCYLLDVLNLWRTAGLLGERIDAFAAVDPTDRATLHLACWLFGGLYVGVGLPISAQRQKTWSLGGDPKTDPDWKPYSWGGHCLAPETRVLTDDLRWVEVGELEPGDGLIGFSEHPEPNRRWWKRGEVEAIKPDWRQCYDLTFEDGTTVRASADHQWLVANGDTQKWVSTQRLQALGPGGRASRVAKPLEVWERDDSRAGGYLAAAFDGEGCLSHHNGENGRSTHRLAFYQSDNEMLAEVTGRLGESGYRFSPNRKSTPGVAGTQASLIALHGRDQIMRFLGSVRPPRLLARFDPGELGAFAAAPWDKQGNSGGLGVRLVEKVDVGRQLVAVLQTDTRTYVAEGLASHNCVYVPNSSILAGAGPLTCVTWGGTVKMTWDWFKTYCDEAYCVVHPDWLARHNGKTPQGFNRDQLLADLHAITS